MDGLLIIDVQKGMFMEGTPHDGHPVVARIASLLNQARAKGIPVFHVQHAAPPGDTFERGKVGFAICDEVAPLPGEALFVKTTRSAFASTDLEQALRAANVDHIFFTGMQTEYCFNTTLLGAVDRGFRATVVRDGHSTLDNEILPAAKIIALHHRIWQGKIAELVPAAQIVL
jgi:aminoglycoside 6'-N-acetyltransferase